MEQAEWVRKVDAWALRHPWRFALLVALGIAGIQFLLHYYYAEGRLADSLLMAGVAFGAFFLTWGWAVPRVRRLRRRRHPSED